MILFHRYPSPVSLIFFARVVLLLECGVTQVSTATDGSVEELRAEPGVDRVLEEGLHVSNGSGAFLRFATDPRCDILFVTVLPPACENDKVKVDYVPVALIFLALGETWAKKGNFVNTHRTRWLLTTILDFK